MTKDEVFAVISNNIVDILAVPRDTITKSKSLSDLGANSVDRMEIITLSMADLGVKIPVMSFAKATCIADLVDIMASASLPTP